MVHPCKMTDPQWSILLGGKLANFDGKIMAKAIHYKPSMVCSKLATLVFVVHAKLSHPDDARLSKKPRLGLAETFGGL
ncbi:hypothetical protein HAX54_043904 [Datura stramonium]|uniref:Uncharacterized protein n=1 Tax=Datura stramonium TaxID=4076 RepID=A0ABS8W553_DATST|nr:hypothetical protein [Datura stramonium]